MKTVGVLTCQFLLALSATAAVTLDCDFSNPANSRAPIYNFWKVRNEIPAYPTVGPQQPPQYHNMNCIRLLGGWSSGDVMNIAEDVVTWDDGLQQYVYHWNKLTNRINGVLSKGYGIHQLVLDNPPWCFQRGLTFSANPGPGEYDIANQVTTYGNSLPPGEPAAWHAFITALMNKLVEVYGQPLVDTWRFRVHTEADYHPHHWAGTKMDYFKHYSNTVHAVRSVLPNAKLAAHFLGASGSGRYGPEFVRWCYTNNVKYDFIGVSYYPFYNNANQVNLGRVYTNDFLPFINQPQWNTNAQLEIPEYSLFTEKDDDGFNMGVGTSHNPAFVAMLAQMLYENAMGNVHNWGDHYTDPPFLALNNMLGLDRFAGQKSGAPANANNKIDAIYAANAARTSVQALVYNYNANPAYLADETVNLSFTVPLPAGTAYEYRVAVCDRANNPHYQFVQEYPLAGLWESEGGWVINRINPASVNQTDKNGLLDQILITTGKNLWNSKQSTYPGYQSLVWSGWTSITTTTGSGPGNSRLNLTVPLSSFSFQKIEFRPVTLSPPWEQGDVGTPAAAGGAGNPGELFTVTGSGNDIAGTADNFHYVYQPVSGDCEIVARVAGLQNTDPWAKAGVMIRESLNANSAHASVLVTPANGVTFQRRTTAGGTSVNTTTAGLVAPYWVKLKRTGNIFTGSRSANGTNWTAFTSATIAMGANVYFGIAVCSHNDGVLATATFDNVSVSIPVANAGPDQTVVDFDANGSEAVTLDGSGSLPGTGSIISYIWKEGATQIASGVKPGVVLGAGAHTITLTVTSSSGATSSATVIITVSPLAAPSNGTLYSDFADSAPRREDGQPPSILGSTASDASLYAGRSGGGGSVDRCMVFPFQLPSLGATASPFSAASFSFNLIANDFAPTNCNLDLYGLTNRTSVTVLASDYYSETDAVDPTPGTTRIQDNICTSTSAVGLYSNSSGGLVNYLNAQYAGGANAGKHVFLRLSKDAAVGTSTKKYSVTAANGAATNNAGSPDYTIWPQITYQYNGLAQFPDTDLDGLPDQWEMQYFGTLTNTAAGDFDGDGQWNGAEYTAGTDPQNAVSKFTMTSMIESPPGSGSFILRWPSVNARTYTVRKSPALVTAVWSAISPPLAGTGAELAFTNSSVGMETAGFYKVQVTFP